MAVVEGGNRLYRIELAAHLVKMVMCSPGSLNLGSESMCTW